MRFHFWSSPLSILLLAALIPGHLFNWGVEWLFVLILACAGFCFYILDEPLVRQKSVFNVYLLFAAVLVGWALFALFWSSRSGAYESGGRDLFDAIRPLVYLYCLYPIWRSRRVSLKDLCQLYRIIFLYSVFWFFVLYFDVPILREFYQLLYGETKTRIEEYIVRLSVPFENPNFLGFISTLGLAVAFGRKKVDWTLVGLSLTCGGLSGSRTAWVVSVLIIFCVACSTFLLRRGILNKSKQVGVLLAGVVFLCILIPQLVDSYQRLADLVNLVFTFDLASDYSYSERIALRADAWQSISDRFFFGWGAAKYAPFAMLDNQYFGVILRYGAIGSAFIMLSCLLFVGRFVTARGPAGPKFLYLGLIVILAIWAWNANILENARLFILLYATLSSVYLSETQYVEI